MAQVGTLTVDLIAQTASFNANIEKAAANLNSQTARMNRSLASINKGFDSVASAARIASFALAGTAFVEMAKKGLEYAASLGETSQQLGVTTRDLQVYRYIGSQVGVAQEDMEKGLAKLTVSLGSAALGASKQGNAFAALGISVRDANGHVKTAGQVIPEIADRLAKVTDPAQRAAIEIALFGKAGQKLDTVLTEGKQGLADYAKQAQDAGMIIGDDVAKAADNASDKIAALTMQLKVNFSREVAENAGAILGLATALERATVAGINFVSNYPRLAGALAGAALGAKLGGTPGAAIGAGIGFIGGTVLKVQNNRANTDLQFRRGALEEIRRVQANALKKFNADPSPQNMRLLQARTQDLRDETARTRAATMLAHSTNLPAVPAGVDLPDFLGKGGGGGGGGGRRGRGGAGNNAADRAREEAIRHEKAFQDELARLSDDLLDARRDNVTDETQLAQMAREQVTIGADKLRADIEAKAKLGEYTRAQADQLESLVDQAKAQKLLTINTQEAQRKADDALRVEIAANDNQIDILHAQEAMASTAAERRKIQLAILELEKKEEKAKLQAVIDAGKRGKASTGEVAEAQTNLNSIDSRYAAKGEVVKSQTKGPLQQYLDDIPDTAAKMNEALDGVKAHGLQNLEDGLMDVIEGTKSVGEAFRNLAHQIISDLLRIAIRKMIVKPLAGLLGLSDGGTLDGLATGGRLDGYAAGGLPGFAGGERMSNGMLRGPGTSTSDDIFALVNGRKPVMLSNHEAIVNARAVRQHWPLIDAMNKGTFPQVMADMLGTQGFAVGGLIGAPTPTPRTALSRTPSLARNDNPQPIVVHVNAAMGERQARETGDQIGRAIRKQMNGPVRRF